MNPQLPPTPPAMRFLVGVFGFVFFGVGLTLLIFMWSADEGFGAPPLFVRIFASFIALAFLAFGGTMCYTALRPPTPPTLASTTSLSRPPTSSTPRYTCPHCAAPLSDRPDVSPLGDTKCPHCGSWFNIHHPPT